MLVKDVAFVNTDGAIFPLTKAINASGPSATDGTEYNANMINDEWGHQYAILDRAGLTPNSILEAPGASQMIEATEKAFGVGPGFLVEPHLNPTVLLNYRVLIPQGQGVLRATYDLLDANNYVGDAKNAAVHAAGGAYYRADDAAGTLPNIVGIYLILPDLRGRTGRVEDAGALVDPDGAGRFLGDHQEDQFQGFQIGGEFGGNTYLGDVISPDGQGYASSAIASQIRAVFSKAFSAGDSNRLKPHANATDGTPRIGTETRMANYSTKKALVY